MWAGVHTGRQTFSRTRTRARRRMKISVFVYVFTVIGFYGTQGQGS